MLKIASIFGTRPEAIKLAPLLKKIKRHPAIFNLVVITTGQHNELLNNALSFFEIKSDYNLRIMQENQSLFDIAKNLIPTLEVILKNEKPNLMLVQGDTSTAFLSSLCAFYLKIPIAHVEAGLRTHDKYSPFPEEMNRRLIGALADFHFAPTLSARKNLIGEEAGQDRIFVVGNTGTDSLFRILKKRIYRKSTPRVFKKIDFTRKILIVTIHRRENFGLPLRNICKAIKSLAKSEKDTEIIFPVHPNPNIRKRVYFNLGGNKKCTFN